MSKLFLSFAILLTSSCAEPTTATSPTKLNSRPSGASAVAVIPSPPTATPIDCSGEPAFVAGPVVAEGQPFDVTSEEEVPKGAEHRFGMGDDVVVSLSGEGGYNYVRVHALNDCGLWLADHFSGSPVFGESDQKKITYTLVKKAPADAGYTTEIHGARVTIVSNHDGSFVATLEKTIPVYEGE